MYHDDNNNIQPQYSSSNKRDSVARRICRAEVIIPILLFTTILLAGFMAMGESLKTASYLRYSTVTGYFLQDEESTDPTKFDYVSTNFGLINRTYDSDINDFDATQWQRFERQVRALNRHAAPGTQYKVLFMGRHGEGFHNVAESWYGTEAWDCYWSLLDGNETTSWSDARLTPVGQTQAQTANQAWRTQLKNQIPFPESFYVSPLNRCLQTAFITFDGLVEPFRPVVKELLRETIGIHTCDRRSSKSAISAEYPAYKIEPGFSENDELWDAELRESDSAQDARLKKFLDDVFVHDDSQFVSFTAHSGAITSVLQVVGHRQFGLQTGGVIPVLVKAERVAGEEPERKIEPPTRKPECKGDPLKAGGSIRMLLN
ncbi:phosphoglycerate mutase family protein [Talaromyces proteolyticus]|uniref:Phosphoglycerate mutase family protein n=1 Tax=Talaromyces proteolyticus TaxID=1131652 RepID=A0AAD4KRC6_9EURO|nr:phosphoglycerate mutase family protein [Talaromyces proteolyticus]KAH8693902.1 phosphoglycerate mutase family protein [Talaromyces proteolyticus]